MEQAIIAGLLQRGIPLHIAQGIAANMAVESGFDPGINELNPTVSGSRGGYGLYQLTGPRRRQYEDFTRQRGVAPDDVDAQLDFLVWELQNTEKPAKNALSMATDARTAARIFSDKFLRPGIPHLDRRLSEADRIAGGGMPAPTNAMPAPPNVPQNVLATAQPNWSYQANMLDPAAFMSRRNNLSRFT